MLPQSRQTAQYFLASPTQAMTCLVASMLSGSLVTLGLYCRHCLKLGSSPRPITYIYQAGCPIVNVHPSRSMANALLQFTQLFGPWVCCHQMTAPGLTVQNHNTTVPVLRVLSQYCAECMCNWCIQQFCSPLIVHCMCALVVATPHSIAAPQSHN